MIKDYYTLKKEPFKLNFKNENNEGKNTTQLGNMNRESDKSSMARTQEMWKGKYQELKTQVKGKIVLN